MRSSILALITGVLAVSAGQATVPPPLYDPPGSYVPDYLDQAAATPIVPLEPQYPPVVSTYSSSDLLRSRRARLILELPSEAQVFVQGQQINVQGSQRTLLSPPLQNRKTYTYVVKATWRRPNGQLVDHTQAVKVWAGAVVEIDFLGQELPAPSR
ncbi:MAG: TIGR03000 domain-containing protein [Gemmataceae bacterium]